MDKAPEVEALAEVVGPEVDLHRHGPPAPAVFHLLVVSRRVALAAVLTQSISIGVWATVIKRHHRNVKLIVSISIQLWA